MFIIKIHNAAVVDRTRTGHGPDMDLVEISGEKLLFK